MKKYDLLALCLEAEEIAQNDRMGEVLLALAEAVRKLQRENEQLVRPMCRDHLSRTTENECWYCEAERRNRKKGGNSQ